MKLRGHAVSRASRRQRTMKISTPAHTNSLPVDVLFDLQRSHLSASLIHSQYGRRVRGDFVFDQNSNDVFGSEIDIEMESELRSTTAIKKNDMKTLRHSSSFSSACSNSIQ